MSDPEGSAGKEWRLVAPEGVDEIKLIEGELALSSMARALGWEFQEIERPSETELTAEEILETSRNIFDSENYGKFALDYIDWMRASATGHIINIGRNHYFKFVHSAFYYQYPGFDDRMDTDEFGRSSEMKRVGRTALDSMNLPFTHEFHFYSPYSKPVRDSTHGTGYHVATAVPAMLTRERMQRYLRATPNHQYGSTKAVAPVGHQLHGLLGRALDVLCVASGTKDSVNPEDTAIHEPYFAMPYSEFLAFAAREGITKAKISTLDNKIRGAFYDQLFSFEPSHWGEIVAEGAGAIHIDHTNRGHRLVEIDELSTIVFRNVDKAYSPAPAADVSAFLEHYK